MIHAAIDRRFALVGFSYSYRCWAWSSISLSLTSTLLPAAILLQPAETLPDTPSARTVPGHAVYGFAVAPLGLTADLAWRHRIHPFLETMEGMIASTEPIPENRPNATGLNFLLDGGGRNSPEHSPAERAESGLPAPAHLKRRDNELQSGSEQYVIYVGYSFLR